MCASGLGSEVDGIGSLAIKGSSTRAMGSLPGRAPSASIAGGESSTLDCFFVRVVKDAAERSRVT